jgi:hypothetical protein
MQRRGRYVGSLLRSEISLVNLLFLLTPAVEHHDHDLLPADAFSLSPVPHKLRPQQMMIHATSTSARERGRKVSRRREENAPTERRHQLLLPETSRRRSGSSASTEPQRCCHCHMKKKKNMLQQYCIPSSNSNSLAPSDSTSPGRAKQEQQRICQGGTGKAGSFLGASERRLVE